MNRKHVLHAGCGGASLPSWLRAERETRLDIDPTYQPDIVGSMADPITVSGLDTIYSSHSLEHLSVADVKKALRGFYEALEPGGVALICVPDLGNVKPTDDVVYMSEIGPITGLDMIYGVPGEHPGMLHRTGFIASTLKQRMEEAGFNPVVIKTIEIWTLLGIGVK